MALEVVLIGSDAGKSLSLGGGPKGEPVLLVQDIGQAFGVFRAISGTVAGTLTAVDVDAGKSIVLTDILISSKKKASSTLDIQFSDGINNEIIFSPDTVTDPVNLGISLSGHWVGWMGADIEVVTVANVIYTITIGYYKVIGGDDFTTWNSKR